jgi:hypothetical protein
VSGAQTQSLAPKGDQRRLGGIAEGQTIAEIEPAFEAGVHKAIR